MDENAVAMGFDFITLDCVFNFADKSGGTEGTEGKEQEAQGKTVVEGA